MIVIWHKVNKINGLKGYPYTLFKNSKTALAAVNSVSSTVVILSWKTLETLERQVVRSQIKCRKYTPSFEVRILRKFLASAATTLVLLPLCSLWSWRQTIETYFLWKSEIKGKKDKNNLNNSIVNKPVWDGRQWPHSPLWDSLQLFQYVATNGFQKLDLALRGACPVHEMLQALF